jgi:hypothetical protein
MLVYFVISKVILMMEMRSASPMIVGLVFTYYYALVLSAPFNTTGLSERSRGPRPRNSLFKGDNNNESGQPYPGSGYLPRWNAGECRPARDHCCTGSAGRECLSSRMVESVVAMGGAPSTTPIAPSPTARAAIAT